MRIKATTRTKTRFHATDTGPIDERRGGERSRDRFRHAGPGELLGVLERDPGADHDEHRGVDVGAAQPPQQHQLEERAERHAERDGERQRDEEGDTQQHHQRVHHVRAERVQLPVREVDHLHDAEDEREPDPEQRVRAAQHERVQAVLEKLGP
jgi:hypothetical protein